MERLKNEVLEQQQRGLEEQNRLQMQMIEDQKRTHDEHVRQLMERMEKEQERMKTDNERVIEAKLKVRSGPEVRLKSFESFEQFFVW